MNRPYVVLNVAMSIDGKISTWQRERIKISNRLDFYRVDKLRASCDAILVGTTTLKKDDPALILKCKKNNISRIKKNLSKNPIKVAILKSGMISMDSSFLCKGNAEKIIFVTNQISMKNIRQLEKRATVIKSSGSRVDISQVLEYLYKRGVKMLLVEGGGQTNFEFLNRKVVDEIQFFLAPIIIGGTNSPTFVDGIGFSQNNILQTKLLKMKKVGDGFVFRYKVMNKREEKMS